MMTKMNIYKVYATALLLLTLLLGQLISVTTAQASSHAGQQKVTLPYNSLGRLAAVSGAGG